MEAAEFEGFWRRLLAAQGEDVHEASGVLAPSKIQERSLTGDLAEDNDGSRPNQLRATVDKEGLHCVVEGSPAAVSDFLRLVSNWEGRVTPGGKL
jgi:hypothetical protein